MAVDPAAVGVLGGTFDPVHAGHVHVAVGAGRALGLREVRRVPAARSPHKRDAPRACAHHRCAMVELAVADLDGIVVDRCEIERGGESFTIDTLREMRARADAVRPVFVLGLDALADLPRWREARALVDEFDLAAVARPGSDLEALRARLPAELAARIVERGDLERGSLPPLGHGGRIVHLPLALVDVSATEIRRRVASGRRIDALVPPSVRRYILEHGLYRDAPCRGSGKEVGR